MYFSGKISVDPAQETLIQKEAPSDIFGQLVDFLTRGKLTPEEEEETFCAVRIIEKLQAALAKVGVSNVLCLAKNQVNFYVDQGNTESDLALAVERFVNTLTPDEEDEFDNLLLALDHQIEDWRLLIEVVVKKRHKVGADPVIIRVNAFPEIQEEVEIAVSELCASQFNFDTKWNQGRAIFGSFLQDLEAALSETIEVTDTRQSYSLRIMRPRTPITDSETLSLAKKEWKLFPHPEADSRDPIFSGYERFAPYLLNSLRWAGALHPHNMMLKELEVVDGHGCLVMKVGVDGFPSGETNTLNPNESFEPCAQGKVQYFEENAFFNEIHRLDLPAG